MSADTLITIGRTHILHGMIGYGFLFPRSFEDGRRTHSRRRVDESRARIDRPGCDAGILRVLRKKVELLSQVRPQSHSSGYTSCTTCLPRHSRDFAPQRLSVSHSAW